MPNLSTLVTNTIPPSSVSPSKLTQPLTLATAKAFNWNGLTTNTFIDFENIPSWAKRITVMLNGVSTNGINEPRIRLGTSSGFVSTGYVSRCAQFDTTNTGMTNATDGFAIRSNAIAATVIGVMQINLIEGNVFVSTYQGSHSATQVSCGSGSVTLTGPLTQLRITTTGSGTDQFDAGTINIMYEG